MAVRTTSSTIFLNPKKILKIAELGLGQKFADLGCGGGGYFVLEAARMVGDKGVAYGVDVLKTALSGLISKVKMDGLTNVKLVWSDLEIYGGAQDIKNGTLDKALLSQLLYQSKDHLNIFRETARMLKKGGWAIVVDWRRSNLRFSPAPQTCVPPERVIEVASRTGFKHIKSFEASPYHYGLIFERI